MPHVIVKLYQGRSEEQKARLAAEIVKDVVDVLNSADESVSLAIEDVKPGEWAEKVYRTDILGNWDKLYKKPGYSGALLSASVRKRSPRSWSTTSCRSSMIPRSYGSAVNNSPRTSSRRSSCTNSEVREAPSSVSSIPVYAAASSATSTRRT